MGLPSYIGGKVEPLSIGECQELVVIQDAVEILYPFGVNISIKNNPLPLVELSTNIFNDPNRKRECCQSIMTANPKENSP